jgi:hypothetical protein
MCGVKVTGRVTTNVKVLLWIRHANNVTAAQTVVRGW